MITDEEQGVREQMEIEEEQRQIDEYTSEVHGFEQYAQARGYEVVYHVFWDYGEDGSTAPTREQWYWGEDGSQHAFQCYQSERDAGVESIRLSIEIYIDRENDVMDHEDCLIAWGGFPA